ncbi:transposase [Saccharothrix luteola]|uniref:transposase n=1 Tax=Saccharothrix luteola TaxID=2893018 RepID=UPI001E3395FD|nr:transposase [Saccharothrix luteola]MCC8242784.1 transposase [Saccharothrix luteola]
MILYDAVDNGVIDTERVRDAFARLPPPSAADGRLVLAVDVSPWLRPHGNTCPDRSFRHTYGNAWIDHTAPLSRRLPSPGARRAGQSTASFDAVFSDAGTCPLIISEFGGTEPVDLLAAELELAVGARGPGVDVRVHSVICCMRSNRFESPRQVSSQYPAQHKAGMSPERPSAPLTAFAIIPRLMRTGSIRFLADPAPSSLFWRTPWTLLSRPTQAHLDIGDRATNDRTEVVRWSTHRARRPAVPIRPNLIPRSRSGSTAGLPDTAGIPAVVHTKGIDWYEKPIRPPHGGRRNCIRPRHHRRTGRAARRTERPGRRIRTV